MVVFVGYHAASRRNRASIQEHGLLPNQPSETQPHGVYCFDPYMDNTGGPTAARCGWSWGPTSDLWRVAYCGPMLIDPCLTNAVVLPSVTDVTLVTGNR